jgi:hypothetical protein
MPLGIPLKRWRQTTNAAYHAVDDPDTTRTSSQGIDPNLSGWPHLPQPLRKSRLVLSGEIALLIFPIAFIGLWLVVF